jgi:hypothetical protein
MHKAERISSIGDLTSRRSIDLPQKPGVYAFWWIGIRSHLLAANRRIVLKGPKKEPVEVEYRDWWPSELVYPCLYVGKTTNIHKRFSLHLKLGSPGRLHTADPRNHKVKPTTTSCQLRWGIEHIFPAEPEPLKLIYSNVGFSFRDDFGDNGVAERFFEEDRLVGVWRPWFNIDSER